MVLGIDTSKINEDNTLEEEIKSLLEKFEDIKHITWRVIY